jgi:hypothetical protein
LWLRAGLDCGAARHRGANTRFAPTHRRWRQGRTSCSPSSTQDALKWRRNRIAIARGHTQDDAGITPGYGAHPALACFSGALASRSAPAQARLLAWLEVTPCRPKWLRMRNLALWRSGPIRLSVAQNGSECLKTPPLALWRSGPIRLSVAQNGSKWLTSSLPPPRPSAGPYNNCARAPRSGIVRSPQSLPPQRGTGLQPKGQDSSRRSSVGMPCPGRSGVPPSGLSRPCGRGSAPPHSGRGATTAPNKLQSTGGQSPD